MNRPLPLATFTAAVVTLTVTGCTAQPNETETVPPQIEHVHGIAADPRGTDLLVATHNGVFTITAAGEVAGPIGGNEFDAMGFTVVDDTLWASGHPGEQTSPELGTPNLGVIRSDDYGATWSPIALNGSTDFHVLTADPDGNLYGIASSGLLVSTDGGRVWTTGAPLPAADLVATGNGLYAATETALMFSDDKGSTFAPVESAPLLYALDAQPNGTLAGVGTDGALWSQNAMGTWERLEALHGAAQAFSVIDTDRFALVDDRGIVEITPDKTTVVAPTL